MNNIVTRGPNIMRQMVVGTIQFYMFFIFYKKWSPILSRVNELNFLQTCKVERIYNYCWHVDVKDGKPQPYVHMRWRYRIGYEDALHKA